MGGFYKRGEAVLLAILIIIIVLFFFGWLINLSQRECKTNKECGTESYCGSDFACHSYPNVQKTVVQYNLFLPAFILGLAIVFAAWLFRQPSQVTKVIEQKAEAKEPEEVADISEPYYKSNGNIRTP